eukprot:CAMPEP_0204199958 /NCGR_PEP_ID=MMETSP0361-20130328/66388_1 /ASSEMBLY_ACC=CAM_ASM_000343 /TAXON_ID=268821 /ORGANISM="Scrippsiella Hangoei, Strain SHTV-5" /LENGTH=141 /DNA_ID=CAMNT_0051162323 /DNA_START=17 /DNA_END=438 /DNA_ORIENTATION=+
MEGGDDCGEAVGAAVQRHEARGQARGLRVEGVALIEVQLVHVGGPGLEAAAGIDGSIGSDDPCAETLRRDAQARTKLMLKGAVFEAVSASSHELDPALQQQHPMLGTQHVLAEEALGGGAVASAEVHRALRDAVGLELGFR